MISGVIWKKYYNNLGQDAGYFIYLPIFSKKGPILSTSRKFETIQLIMSSPKKKKNTGGIVLIKKANNLIEARYRFDVWETRVFLSILGQIKKDDEDLHPYRIKFADIKRNFQLKSNQSYAFLRDATQSLMDKRINVTYRDADGVERERTYNIIRYVDVLKEGQEGLKDISAKEYVDIQIAHELKPLLLQLQRNFTAYDLRNTINLGASATRFYELLKQYEQFGVRKFEISDIRSMMELEHEYSKIADFFRYFVEPALKDITDHSDLSITNVEKIKEGRNIVAFKVIFRKKTDEELAIIRGELGGHQPMLFTENEMAGQGISDTRPLTIGDLPADLAPAFTALGDWAEKLDDFWGVNKTIFYKAAEGKTEGDIIKAFDFTKARIKDGGVTNPAGMFLTALENGYKNIEQHRAEKRETQAQRTARITELKQEVETLKDAYAAAVNNIIRQMVDSDPTVREKAIESVRAAHRLQGDFDIDHKTLDDFRNDPHLRNDVKSEIIRANPDAFATAQQKYVGSMQQIRATLKELQAT
jgi:plasmid replication initiation protein